jgi:hypothetical protein
MAAKLSPAPTRLQNDSPTTSHIQAASAAHLKSGRCSRMFERDAIQLGPRREAQVLLTQHCSPSTTTINYTIRKMVCRSDHETIRDAIKSTDSSHFNQPGGTTQSRQSRRASGTYDLFSTLPRACAPTHSGASYSFTPAVRQPLTLPS